jgi:hypothetical protein
MKITFKSKTLIESFFSEDSGVKAEVSNDEIWVKFFSGDKEVTFCLEGIEASLYSQDLLIFAETFKKVIGRIIAYDYAIKVTDEELDRKERDTSRSDNLSKSLRKTEAIFGLGGAFRMVPGEED